MQITSTHQSLVNDDKDWETCIKIDGAPGIGPHVTSGRLIKCYIFLSSFPLFIFKSKGEFDTRAGILGHYSML